MVLLKMQSDIVSKKKILQTAPWGLHYVQVTYMYDYLYIIHSTFALTKKIIIQCYQIIH